MQLARNKIENEILLLEKSIITSNMRIYFSVIVLFIGYLSQSELIAYPSDKRKLGIEISFILCYKLFDYSSVHIW